MTKFTMLAALTLAAAGATLALGSAPAHAALCDGTWRHQGKQQEMQCYSLPTVHNGRVDGLSFHRNFRPNPPPIGYPPGHGSYYRGGGKR